MTNRIMIQAHLILVSTIIFAQACAPQTTPTPFRPPTSILPTQLLPTTTPVPALLTASPVETITATVTPGPCINELNFVDDITVEDGTTFLAGSPIDKQWLVQNSGTCNWDSTYRLKWVGGDPLGAAQEQLIYPAKAGTQATLRITFTAPVDSGTYESSWQAVDPSGNLFGDFIFMQIVVQP